MATSTREEIKVGPLCETDRERPQQVQKVLAERQRVAEPDPIAGGGELIFNDPHFRSSSSRDSQELSFSTVATWLRMCTYLSAIAAARISGTLAT